MVKMINMVTGTEMWVADDRVTEYRRMGHKVAKGSLVAMLAKEEAEKHPIEYPAHEPNPVEEAAKNLKKTLAKSKATRKKA